MEKFNKMKMEQIKYVINEYYQMILINIMEYKPLCLILFMYIILYIFAPPFPNIVGLQDVSLASTLLFVVAGALASILGIVVAVMLVAYEILKRIYSAYAFKSIFNNRYLKTIISVYIITIIISSVTIITLSSPLSNRNIDHIYYSFILFVLALSILFPHLKQILTSTESKNKIIELVQKISYSEISLFDRRSQMEPATNYVSRLEESPIYVLSEAAIRTIKDNDRLTPKLILTEATNRLIELLKSSSGQRRRIIEAFLIIFKNASTQAISLRQEGVVQVVLDCIEYVHLFCAEEKAPWYVMIELDELLRDIINESIEAGLDDVARSGHYRIERIMQAHLKNNIPPENEIWDLQLRAGKDIPPDHDKSLQWRHVSDDYVRMISGLVEKAIGMKRAEVISSGLWTLGNIGSYIINSELGELQKDDVLRWINYYSGDLTLKCVDAGLQKQLYLISPFRAHYIEDALDKNARYSKYPLTTFSESLIKLAKKGYYDTFILNELGTTGRGVVRRIGQNKIYKEALLYIIEVFSKIREILEQNMSGGKGLFYIELFTQIESLKKWMVSEKKKDENIDNKLADALSKFNRLNEIKAELEEGHIKWPEISSGG
jgi:hypothetical protein